MIYPGLNVWKEILDLVSMNSNWKHMWLVYHQNQVIKPSQPWNSLGVVRHSWVVLMIALFPNELTETNMLHNTDLSHQSRMWTLMLERSSGFRATHNSSWFHKFFEGRYKHFHRHSSFSFFPICPSQYLTSIAANFSLPINDAIHIAFSLWGLDKYDIYQR